MKRLNVIIITLQQSIQLISIFMGALIIFNLILVPLAQSVWGPYLIGYKGFWDCMNSVFLIAYSKGDLVEILDLNFIWSLIFMVMYYFFSIFILHAAFHMVQTDALKNVVLLFSLQETDVIDRDGTGKRKLTPLEEAEIKRKNTKGKA